MKLGPVTKLDKRHSATSKKKFSLTTTSCWQIVTSLPLFRFMANLQPLGNRISDGWSIKFTFSLIVTFLFIKPENRTKKSLDTALMLLP